MMGKIKYLVFFMFMIIEVCHAQEMIRGRVLDKGNSKPLSGATISLRGGVLKTVADANGFYMLNFNGNSSYEMTVSHLGYKTQIVKLNASIDRQPDIKLEAIEVMMEEITVISNGYQSLPKERSTGSFVQINKELLERTISTDVLSRLQDVVPGLIFNRGNMSNAAKTPLTIRGQSTIFASADPLIVLDNFPYQGDLNDINPNDIASITVLKDAAASSIWGAKAGNGVIIITSKKGNGSKPPSIGFSANINFGEKPNQFYEDRMTVADYIETEALLFAKGFYAATEASLNKTPLTPVVELLIAKRDGKLSATKVNELINVLKGQDIRNDLTKYVYRNNINQQYALSLTGGNETQSFYVFGGYDDNDESLKGNNYKRYTFNSKATFSFFKGKLLSSAAMSFSRQLNTIGNQLPSMLKMTNSGGMYPYALLANENGTPLVVTKDYRKSFIEAPEQAALLDWKYRPLEEIGLSQNSMSKNGLQLNGSLKYQILKNLSAQVLYQSDVRFLNNSINNSERSYLVRNLINGLSFIKSDGDVSRPIPVGGIVDLETSKTEGYFIRGQIDYSASIGKNGNFNFISGWEKNASNNISNNQRLYGYDEEHATVKVVDYITAYKDYVNPAATRTITNMDSEFQLFDRFSSMYANASYNLKDKYTVTGSARWDRSNIFGVRANQNGVPLWSMGLAWNVAKEEFYKWDMFPVFRARFTYGYNGNIDRSLSAYITAQYYSGSNILTKLPYAKVINPPNPELRWERVEILNAAIDFGSKNNLFNGTLEFYNKQGKDLIGNTTYPASTGITSFKGNYANTRTQGIDINLNYSPPKSVISWNSSFFISYSKDVVTNYSLISSVNNMLSFGQSGSIPILGKSLYTIYSYKWAGLDEKNGDPIGYLNGEKSSDYAKIINAATPDNLIYNGSSRPILYGAFRNTLTWKSFSVSANVSFRLGYYFRKNSVSYGSILAGQGGHGDFALRWKNAGDEKITNVPSMPLMINTNRDNFYSFSEILVAKADHVRLQDIRIAYDLDKINYKQLPFERVSIFVYANNIGLIWAANSWKIDPDFYVSGPPPKTLALGVKVNL